MSSLTIGKGYAIQGRIGRGSFGEVYDCTGPNSSMYAAKLEHRREKDGSKRRGPSQLRYEERVYRHLEGGTGVPRIVEYFTCGDYNVLVMERLGKSLEDVLEERGGRLSAKCTLAIGIRLLQTLEHIHSRGIIHRDLKPQNMMLSQDRQNSHIFLIDYGLAKRFDDPVTGHVEYSTSGRGLIGTPRYASISSHSREQARRDDLESLYILSYLRRGELAWQGVRGRQKGEICTNFTS